MSCRLRLLWVEADGSARPALARAAAAALGRGRASGDAVGFGSARWAEAEEWSVPDQVHAVVARREDGAFLRYSLPAWDRWRPAPGEVERRAREERRRAVAELAAAVRGVAGIDQGARQAMLALLDRSPDPDAPRPVPNAVAALQAWTAALARLEPGQRASALLAADRVAAVAELPQPEPRGGPAQKGVVRVGGAEMAYGELGGGWSYAHNFLREALAIASPGPIRDRALLREMEIAFDYTGTCSAGEDLFGRIIAAGEALLARSRDREVLAQAGFMVADAHATVVALASGAGGEYADPARYARREPEARRKAIAAYRAALALDRSSERARAAWSTAWRLLAGLSPEAPKYFCIYD